MSLTASVGVAQGLEGRETAMQAARHALDQLGKPNPTAALVIFSQEFPAGPVLAGVSNLLGPAPLWGASSKLPLANMGYQPRSVVVALLAGSDLKGQSTWWPDYSNRSQAIAQQLVQTLRPDSLASRTLLLAADGLAGNAQALCETLHQERLSITGCLAGGDVYSGKTFQIGGNQAGSGGLASLLLTGDLRMGVGTAHGWQPVGPSFRITAAEGNRIVTLDDVPAAQAYSQVLGYTTNQWTHPPLSEMVHLYPLGIEQGGAGNLVIHSPLRVESDGSFWMNKPVQPGSTGHLMVGAPMGCLKAAEQAAQQAAAALKPADPALALVFIDTAWQMLLEHQSNPILPALRGMLGARLPAIGGFTPGQFYQSTPGQPVQLLNQHIEIILLA